MLRSRNIKTHVSSAGKWMLALVMLFSFLISQNGIEFKNHMCLASGHEHVDMNLLAGFESWNICLNEEDNCCKEHDHSEMFCEPDCSANHSYHKDDCLCSDEIQVIVSGIVSIKEKRNIYVEQPQVVVLFARASNYILNIVESNCEALRHNASCYLFAPTRLDRCTQLCTMNC